MRGFGVGKTLITLLGGLWSASTCLLRIRRLLRLVASAGGRGRGGFALPQERFHRHTDAAAFYSVDLLHCLCIALARMSCVLVAVPRGLVFKPSITPPDDALFHYSGVHPALPRLYAGRLASGE